MQKWMADIKKPTDENRKRRENRELATHLCWHQMLILLASGYSRD